MSSLAGCTESLPKAESFWEEFGTIKIVDDIFEPVTWHHQRRPFIRALTCKTTKTHRGWPAEPPPTIKSVQYFYEEERQRESERERVQEDGKIPLSSSPYSPAC
jgi:hypothetical protein